MWNYFSTKYWTPTTYFSEASSANMATWPKTQHVNIKAKEHIPINLCMSIERRKKPKRISFRSEDFEGNKTVWSWLFSRGFATIALLIGCLLAQGMPWKLRPGSFDTLHHQWSTRAPSDFLQCICDAMGWADWVDCSESIWAAIQQLTLIYGADGFILGVGIDILCLGLPLP